MCLSIFFSSSYINELINDSTSIQLKYKFHKVRKYMEGGSNILHSTYYDELFHIIALSTRHFMSYTASKVSVDNHNKILN